MQNHQDHEGRLQHAQRDACQRHGFPPGRKELNVPASDQFGDKHGQTNARKRAGARAANASSSSASCPSGPGETRLPRGSAAAPSVRKTCQHRDGVRAARRCGQSALRWPIAQIRRPSIRTELTPPQIVPPSHRCNSRRCAIACPARSRINRRINASSQLSQRDSRRRRHSIPWPVSCKRPENQSPMVTSPGTTTAVSPDPLPQAAEEASRVAGPPVSSLPLPVQRSPATATDPTRAAWRSGTPTGSRQPARGRRRSPATSGMTRRRNAAGPSRCRRSAAATSVDTTTSRTLGAEDSPRRGSHSCPGHSAAASPPTRISPRTPYRHERRYSPFRRRVTGSIAGSRIWSMSGMVDMLPRSAPNMIGKPR